jgi:hypothetical protein
MGKPYSNNMIIKNIKTVLNKKEITCSADVIFKNKRPQSVFFALDKKYKNFICKDASAYLPALLFCCMRIKEEVIVEGVIESKLFSSTKKIMELLESWRKIMNLKKTHIKSHEVLKDNNKPKNIGLFFSGGADSFYTYLKNKHSSDEKINYLIFVHGFDIKLESEDTFKRTIHLIEKICKKEKIKLVVIKTNLREITDQYVNWDIICGPALASVALFLRNKFKKIYISSGIDFKHLKPLGTHPQLDPLWSSTNLRIIHDGCEATRVKKVQYIGNFEIVQQSLRVCWRNRKGFFNCCECEKCLRTMLALYSAGTLDKCKTFNKPISPHILKKLHVFKSHLRHFKQALNLMQKNNDKSDISKALEECILRNENRSFFSQNVINFKQSLGNYDSKYNSGRLFYFLNQKGLL